MASMPAPFFLAYGLRKEAFVGTMGLSVFSSQLVKLAGLGHAGFLTGPAVARGLALAPFVIAGTWLGRAMLTRVSESAFAAVIDAILLCSGALFLIRG